MATKYLDELYDDTQARILEMTQSKVMCLTTDTWTNVNGISVVNYVALTDQECVFLESQESGVQRHSGAWIAEDVTRVIEKYSNIQVAGVVTDNMSANKTAWEILESRFPKKYFYGTINFFHCYILIRMCSTYDESAIWRYHEALHWIHWRHEGYREMLQQVSSVEGWAHGQTTSIEEEASGQTLWHSMVLCTRLCTVDPFIRKDSPWYREFARLPQGKKQSATTTSKTSCLKYVLLSIVFSFWSLGERFVGTLKMIISILDPIAKLCKKYQGQVPLSDILSDFAELHDEYALIELSSEEAERIRNLVKQRQAFITSRAHVMAYILDPKYVGAALTHQEFLHAEIWICSAANSPAEIDEMYRELSSFVLKSRHEKEASTQSVFSFSLLYLRNYSLRAPWKTEQNPNSILGYGWVAMAQAVEFGADFIPIASLQFRFRAELVCNGLYPNKKAKPNESSCFR